MSKSSLLIVLVLAAFGNAKRHKGMNFFVASSPDDDCSAIPAEPMRGNPMMDACQDASEMDEMCVCVQKPPKMLAKARMLGMEFAVNEEGYTNVCGQCFSPCQMRFRPMIAPDALPLVDRMMGMISSFVENALDEGMDDEDEDSDDEDM